MLPGRKYTPDDIIRILSKGRWYIIVPVFFCTFAALLISRTRPDMYMSETIVQVLGQRVPDSYVRTTVTSSVEERLKQITEVIKSRTQLEQLINEFNLYPEQRAKRPLDDVIAMMRANVIVEPAGAAAGGRRSNAPVTAFRVAFSYPDKELALKTAQRITEMLIRENTEMRGNLAEATNEFLETQLADARRRLEEQERKLEAFRLRHAGSLPSQLQANMQAVQTTQMQLNSTLESLARDRDRKLMLERLYNDNEQMLRTLATTPPPSQQADPATATGSPQQRLVAARANLEQLKLRLKPDHPDIRRTQRLIEELEAQVKAEGQGGSETPRPASPEEVRRREQLAQQRAEIESLTRQISMKEREVARLQQQLATYQARIEAVPALESEETALMRDYETLQLTYQGLLAKSEDSKVAANLERRQIGEQFRVLDAPRVAEEGTGANRLQINLGGFALGLLIGLGYLAFREFRDTSYRSEADVTTVLSLPVLAVVPFAATPADIQTEARRRRTWRLAAVAVLAVSGTVFVVLEMWKYVI
ncbi:MAG TPA: Wzz/FepE/Etk N-terminal domain-containing protein [Vicinamibacterales bacterium]